VLGYVGPITGAEIKANPNAGYQTDSVIGKTGIESFYEQFLRGKDGTSSLEVSANGQILGSVHTTQPQVGDSVVLNIDTGCRRRWTAPGRRHRARAQLGRPLDGQASPAINGAAVVMDVNNGAGAGDVELSLLQPDSFVNGLTESTFHQLLSEGAFNNYAIQGLYTPGSTFKLITATAMLQTGISPRVQVHRRHGQFQGARLLPGEPTAASSTTTTTRPPGRSTCPWP
jgi:penicillin-binding protein 2